MEKSPHDPVHQRTITKLPFDQSAVPDVALLLGVEAHLAPFQLPGADVYQMTIRRADSQVSVVLTLWPSIRRIDAISPHATIVFTDVAVVELVEGVEVLFRRTTGEYLIVTIAGKVIVRA